MSQASTVAAPGVPGPGVKILRAKMDGLRELMRGLGLSYDEIAAEVSRRYHLRPRAVYRLSCRLRQSREVERVNDREVRESLRDRRRRPDLDRRLPVRCRCSRQVRGRAVMRAMSCLRPGGTKGASHG